ncbi:MULTISPECIES: GGDEF domain-containing phosphodiesterase [Acinetobacter]|uniref:Phosphodiesterase n=2 Tax=Acinetobacter TaxID=469 RepID=A0A4Q7B4L5_9GAMM|nr:MULTISPECIES: GGDEF domain-containing phosphodiesterase [Acinetobacter]MCW8038687.1 EAL domain-containing protein [Acinetobacter entericus]RZG69798.1 phosphodiesterase [Acinetobacter bouvetii]TCB74841.1 phosphodiesterase [Acinetobacter sp. ANC 4177]
MTHVHYDYSLVLVSAIVALLACYFAVSVEQTLFRGSRPKYEWLILICSGALLGAAIWCMHFVAIMASQMPGMQSFHLGLSLASYLIAFAASVFAIWLTTRFTLPLFRLTLGAVLMGLGISGMHYTGMLALNIQGYEVRYEPVLAICSILIAIGGSWIAFLLAFRNKHARHFRMALKFAIAFTLTMTIVVMHYTGMAAMSFIPVNPAAHVEQATGFDLQLLTVIFMTCLILGVAFCVAMLERRLEERSRQLTKANRELANLAVQDNLTKLPNRLFLAEYAHFLFTDQRYQKDQIAFLYIDLDRFKAVNDVFGHHVGDQLLIQLANRLHRLLDEHSKLLRIGGDEFLMVLESATSEKASAVAEKILELIQDSFLIAGKEINVSGSIGIAMYPEHGSNLQDLLINADAAMLTSKDQGRNTFSLFCYSSDQNEAKSQTKLINDLYKAVEDQQFVLFYQPKFKACERGICGVEALIRWKHPSLGMLTPNMFIRGAEKTGLIIRMGYWALEEACKQIKAWEHTHPHFLPISVNLSAIQFEHKYLFATLDALLSKYKVDSSYLMIEITESTAMHHIENSIRTLERLRQMGIKLAIDDFGTGHSSFLYLKNLPVDELKIDKEFIYDLTPNSKEEMILESIIQLAIKLGLVVTAEGVETPLQAEILTRLGCQQLQGYLLGLPVGVVRLEASEYL